uniref:Uncharacterized protein n=1 Tax=Tanacetum cinerariifolium TaxID=118510 RepID=A0A6L2LZ46_TANCI|nr:hypothetical protein [Tanacetum cinerariifolium]
MTGNLKLLINFVWKFMGTARFGNDHVAAILGFGDLQWGNILITRVYFVEGWGHNLFSVGQFCDSDLEVAFRRNAYFIRNLEGVDLLKGYRSTNFYTINLHEMASASPICLMTRAFSTKLWKKQNNISSTKTSSKFEAEITSFSYELCGPMRIANINGKRCVLVIVDDYSRYTWVHFLRSKDEAPEVIIKFLKTITVLLRSPGIIIRTDNSTEFKNQNRVVERRNWTLVEAAKTMLIFSRAPLFLWVEAIATACFTKNRSIIHRLFNKTPYELINGRKPDISFLYVFGALCYPKNDREDIGKLGTKGDIGFFIGYSADSCAYRVYNRRTKKIMDTMNVSFDELSAMAFEQRSSKPRLQSMTSGHISSRLDLTYDSSTITTQQPSEGELDLLFKSMYDDYIGGQPSATARTVPPTQEHQVRQTSTASTTIVDTVPIPTNSSSLATNILISSQDVDELNPNAMVDGNTIFLAYAAHKSFTMFQMDVKTAFLYSSLKEDVYVCQPEGFIDADHPSHVYKLKKALYGLKQAPRACLQVNQSPCGIFINQSKYVLEILNKYGMVSCDPVGTPMEIKDKLDLDHNGTPVDATKYRSMIGALMYFTSSRLDIVHATCLCARYQAKPTEKHLKELTDYGFHFNMIPIYCDSKSAIAISCNPVQHSRTKHIAIRYHFIKEHVEKGTIELYFVKTDYQLADIFTKALPTDRFNYLVRRLGMRSLSPKELERLAKS